MKKEYKAPVVVAAEHVVSSAGGCGKTYYGSACGEQVQST